MSNHNQYREYWIGRAYRLSVFVNLIGWLERLLPGVIAVNLIGCCLVVYLRGQEMSVQGSLWLVLGCVAVLGVVLALRLRRRAFSVFAALLRLETAMRLDNQLTTAHEGVVAWPSPQKIPSSLFVLRWQRPLLANLGSWLLLFAAYVMPLQNHQEDPLSANPSPPVALAEVEDWIDQLQEEMIVEESALQELQEAVDDLKSRPSDEWYTAGALEAADSLNEQFSKALSSLAHELQTSSALLAGIQNLPDTVSPEQLNRLSEVYNESVDNLEAGSLPLSSEMLDMMKQLDFNQLGSVGSDTLEQLQARSELLSQAAQLMSDLSPEEKQRLEEYYKSLKEGMCEGGPSERMVPGGIGRGRDDADMSYSQYRSPDGTHLTEAVSNSDVSQAAIADTIRTSISQQREGKNAFSGASAGGGVSSTGEGGDAVWVDRLTPAERKVLQNYFK
ncbi:MAG: hypothetical protein ACSHYA_19455 [Opitutaceae bacterium]